MQDQDNIWKSVFDHMPYGVIVADENGNGLLSNPAAQQMLGIDLTLAKPGTWAEHYGFYLPDKVTLYPAQDLPQVRARGSEPLPAVELFVRNPGVPEGLWVEATVTPRRDAEGALRGSIFVFRDITNRKQAEEARGLVMREQAALHSLAAGRHEAQEVNQIKDDLLGAISRELRAPLTSILGWAQILRTSGFDKATLEHGLAVIERNAKTQVQGINDLLDISLLVTGKVHLDRRPLDLRPLIEAAIETVRSEVDEKGIQLRIVLDPHAKSIFGDPDRLKQVIWNLLSNAVKFTPPEGRIQVQLERLDADMEILVSDTGAGIRSEFLPYIFDGFYPAYSPTPNLSGSHGLGLAIVRHLVELHGGSVSAESRGEGQGARFRVKLPLQEPTHLTAADHAVLAAAELRTLHGLQVLVVDDEPDTCELLAMAFSRHGAKVKVCSSASAALKLLEQWQPNVLVSDIGMAGEDGYALIRKVRALPPDHGGQVPAIALTAFVQKEDQQRALSAGYQIHVAKPVAPNELVTVVAKLATLGVGGKEPLQMTNSSLGL